MSKHKKELTYVPAVKLTEGNVPIVRVGDANVFSGVKVQLDAKTGAKIPDGTALSIYIGWED